jgi:hypothetical protein
VGEWECSYENIYYNAPLLLTRGIVRRERERWIEVDDMDGMNEE